MHVIGTAGHVDHGKSSLVRALTGIDPDRLAEEKEREMTIDLGFAWLKLGNDEVGIVDVPGHRDFIENMLAGVGGIDLALFVIAADEGVMPQTREHLAIIDLLGIEHGIIALTKTDLVEDEDWLELVTLEVAELVSTTKLKPAPIVPVSARSGVGLDTLKATISNALATVDSRPDLGQPVMPIDRVFTLSGFGTVVTGTLTGGSFNAGDEVEVVPGGLRGRIRGLQTHKTKRQTAVPGSRVAINLTGIEREQLARGQVVALPGMLRATRLVDAEYRQLPDAPGPLEHNDEVKVFVGSAEIGARVRVLAQENIPPGAGGYIQLALAEPAAVNRSDRFILRRPSPGTTLGGGRVLDAHPGRRHRRFRQDVAERLEVISRGSPAEIVLSTLGRLRIAGVDELVARSGLDRSLIAAMLQQLQGERTIVPVGSQYLTGAEWLGLKRQAVNAVSEFHVQQPLRLGMEREALRSRLRLPVSVFNDLLQAAASEGLLEPEGTLIKVAGHTIDLSAEQRESVAELLRLLDESGANTPSVKDCRAQAGDELFYALVAQGDIVLIGTEIVYTADRYEAIVAQLTAYMTEHGSVTAAQARDSLGTSRKYAIALLEHLDQLKITRRVGDARELARVSREQG